MGRFNVANTPTKRLGRFVLLGCAVAILLSVCPPAHAQRKRARRLFLKRKAAEWHKYDRWTRFREGSWRKSRTTTQVLDGQGRVKQERVETTTTTLRSVSLSTYELLIERTRTVQGKQLPTKSETLVVGLFGQKNNQVPEFVNLQEAAINLNGKKITAQGTRVVLRGGKFQVDKKIYRNPDLCRFPLRIESETSSSSNNKVKLTQLREVLALDMPAMVNSKVLSLMMCRTIEKNGKSTAISIERISDKIPGGTVTLSVKQLDDKGKVVVRRSVQLLDYRGEVLRRRRRLR